MNAIPDSKLLLLNSQGIVPGPDENEAEFIKRADYCLALKSRCNEIIGKELPFALDKEGDRIIAEALPITQKLYGITPEWIPLFFSNYKLGLWHGGCAWIFSQEADSPTSAFFQLRRGFRDKKRLFGLYDRNELIAHELAHAGRMVFEEPRFEEILAYHSSSSAWRRFLGPIVRSPWESALFLLSLLLISLFSVAAAGYPHYRFILSWLLLLPFILAAVGVVRLWLNQSTFAAALEKLEKLMGSKEKANALIYRLTDKEIAAFARLSPEAIHAHAVKNKESNLRWRLLWLGYFSDKDS